MSKFRIILLGLLVGFLLFTSSPVSLETSAAAPSKIQLLAPLITELSFNSGSRSSVGITGDPMRTVPDVPMAELSLQRLSANVTGSYRADYFNGDGCWVQAPNCGSNSVSQESWSGTMIQKDWGFNAGRPPGVTQSTWVARFQGELVFPPGCYTINGMRFGALAVYLSRDSSFSSDEAVIGKVGTGSDSTFFVSSPMYLSGTYHILAVYLESGDGRSRLWMWPVDATGCASATSTPVPPTPSPRPSAPSDCWAQAASQTQMNLGWAGNSNNEDGFKVYRKLASGGTWSQVAQVGANSTSHRDSGLQCGTSYQYYVIAFNASGISGQSNTATANTNACSVPTATPIPPTPVPPNPRVTPSISSINHSPSTIKRDGCEGADPGAQRLTIQARVTSQVGIQDVKVYYLAWGGGWQDVPMGGSSGNVFDASIGPFPNAGVLTYRIKAWDTAGGVAETAIYSVSIESCPVVVLVHGWQGISNGPQSGCSGITHYPNDQNFRENATSLGDLPDWLYKEGYDVWSAHLETGPQHTPYIRKNAECLRGQLAQVEGYAPDGKVILIAHSMGGVVARVYLEDDSLYVNNVKMLFTLGSPHNGIDKDLINFWLPGLWWKVRGEYPNLPDFQTWRNSQQQLLTEFVNPNIINANHSPRRPGVDYYAISGDLPVSRSSWAGGALSTLIPGSDDGLVQQASGLGLNGTHNTRTSEGHAAMFVNKAKGGRTYFGVPPGDNYSMAYSSCILPALQGRINTTVVPMLEASTLTSEPAYNAFWPSIQGTLTSSHIVSHTISLDGGGAAFLVATWSVDGVAFTLTSPSGQAIDAAYATTHPNEVIYAADDGTVSLGASYALLAPEAGVWTLNLQSGKLSGGSADYARLVAMESPITLAVASDKNWYPMGQTAAITATVGGGVTATVQVQLRLPDGATDNVMLAPQGGGLYRGAYAVPALPGFVTLFATASGTDNNGLDFQRETMADFQVAPNTVSLAGNYAEATEPNATDASFYRALTVSVGIDARVSGTFGLAADLVDQHGNLVAHSLCIQNVAAGPSTLALRFDGDDIYAARRNGPYVLTRLLLTDQQGAGLIVTEAQNVYTTAPYDHRRFGSPTALHTTVLLPVLLKSVLFTQEDIYYGSAEDSIYRVSSSAFRGYSSDSASDSRLRRISSPPAPSGWNQPGFVPDVSWHPAAAVWFDAWSLAPWSPIPSGCQPIGLLGRGGEPEGVDGTTHLFQRTFALPPPLTGHDDHACGVGNVERQQVGMVVAGAFDRLRQGSIHWAGQSLSRKH